MFNTISSSKSQSKIHFIITIFLFVFLILADSYVISKHQLFHKDEYYSYSCANHYGKELSIEPGQVYSPANVPFIELLSTKSDEIFQFDQIWKNEATNAHPPFYYIFIHLVCGIIPNTFSLWYAGIVNIFFSVLTLIFLRKIVLHMTNDMYLAHIISIYFVLSYGILNVISFLRMYSMSMFVCTWLTFLFISYISTTSVRKSLVYITIASASAALTHYYCAIFLVMLCFVTGLILLLRKDFSRLLLLIMTELVSAFISVIVFPPILSIFSSTTRGTQSIDNLSSRSMIEYINFLSTYFKSLCAEFIGLYPWGYIIVITLCIFALAIAFRKNSVKDILSGNAASITSLLQIVLPMLLFFAAIAKITEFPVIRYLYPVFPLFLLTVILILYWSFSTIFPKKYYMAILLLAILFFSTLSLATLGYPSNLRYDTKKLYEEVSSYSNADVVCMYRDEANIRAQYALIKNAKSIVFIPEENIDLLNQLDYHNSSEVILLSEKTDIDYRDIFIEKYPEFTNVDRVGKNWNIKIYHLTR